MMYHKLKQWLAGLPHKNERPAYFEGDYFCSVCGEPWDSQGLKEDMGIEAAIEFLDGKGCPCCKGK